MKGLFSHNPPSPPPPGNATRSKLLGLNDDWLVIIPKGVHESSVEFIIVNL